MSKSSTFFSRSINSTSKPRDSQKVLDKLILPGLIDPHVHLRDPGQTNKEDFYTGTCAAIAGGFTTILDMPNNKIPITTNKLLNEKIKIAKGKIACDVGFHFGSLGDNINELKKIKQKVTGLKLYLSLTTGGFIIPKEKVEKIFKIWPKNKVILLHAEDNTLDFVISLAKKLHNKIHICHISTTEDLKKIIKAKKRRIKISCGVTPHHLFLTERDVKHLGSFGKMKPPLQNKKDQDFLWKNLKFIDVIESDHAPHTIDEKRGVMPAFGVPGLETTLPLLLTEVSKKKLKISDIIRLCHTNPAKIFNIKTDKKTKVEVDLSEEYIIKNKNLFTKCKWSSFENRKVKGKLLRVFIRGKKVFENGKILSKKGSGKIVYSIIE